MHSFIMKITHSLPAKDTIAVVRGLYKVIQGGINVSKVENPSNILSNSNSWHNPPKQVQFGKEAIIQIKQQSNKTNQTKIQVVETQQSKNNTNTQIKQKQNNNKIYEHKIQLNYKYNDSVKVQKPQLKTQETYKQQIKHLQTNKSQQKKQKFNPIQSKVPSSRFSRFYQFGKLGLNIAQSAVEAYFTSDKNPQKQQQTYQKIANKISEELCKMRGAPLKLAQMLSIQQDKLIPIPIRKAFQKARQTAHILPIEQVQFMMSKNLGSEWKQKFITFDKKPFASASIGQVHKGKLLKENNEEVAVKIQYPGVRKSIQSDISNLNLLMKIPGAFPKGMYMDRILKKTKEQLTDQCDYLLEKEKQEVYEKCLKLCLKKDFQLYKVPKVYSQLTTEQILTTQYLSGISMKNLQQNDYPQQIRDEVGRRIMQITFNQIFEMGIVQSDPNPANFTYNAKTDQLNLFDFGATHVYKKKFLQDYYEVIQGSVLQDKTKIIQSSIKTGFLTGQQSISMNQSHIQSILIVGQPLRFQGKYDFGNQHITQRIYKTIPYMLKNRLKHPPEQVYSLHRKLSGSYLACMRLKAKVNCNKIWNEIKFQRIIENIQMQEKSRLII